MFNSIKKYFSNSLTSPAKLIKEIKYCTDKNLINEISNYLLNHPEYENKTTFLIKAVCLNKFPKKKCKTCGKMMTYSKSLDHDFCSCRCAQLSKTTRNKFKETCLQKYGCEHHLKNKNVIKERKQNSLKKYGGVSPASSNKIKNKMKETCLKKYGVEFSGQSKEKK